MTSPTGPTHFPNTFCVYNLSHKNEPTQKLHPTSLLANKILSQSGTTYDQPQSVTKTTVERFIQQVAALHIHSKSNKTSRNELKATRGNFISEIPIELQERDILADMSIEDVFDLGTQTEAYAKLALSEIVRRHPRFLPDVTKAGIATTLCENLINTVIFARTMYLSEINRGKQALLIALKECHPEYETCTTIEEALSKKQLIPLIESLILRNPNKKPLFIPSIIGQFTELKILSAQNCALTGLPPEIGQCRQLCRLVLKNNLLTSIPAEISQCKNLEFLDISNNSFFPLFLSDIWRKLPDVQIWR